MNRTLPGLPPAAAGFDEPLAMLAACHDRMERQCATLERLAAHLPLHGADAPARDAAAAVLRWFDTAAVHHHADEEQDLFPALLESMAGSDPVCLRELTEALSAEHRALAGRWRALRPALAGIAAGAPAELDGEAARAFVAAYRQHLAREDAELLPMAAGLLDESALARIGRAMGLRRGARPVA